MALIQRESKRGSSRWSKARERHIGSAQVLFNRTSAHLMFNGYEEQVAALL